MGIACSDMSWAQSRDTSGELLVVWSHGGGCLSFIPTLPSAKQTWKEEQALAAVTEDGIGSSV